MKVLFLSNLYPPHFIGGYEQLCMDAVDGLTARGHECHVLTSTYGVDRQTREGHVYRLLQLEGDFYGARHGLAELNSIRVSNERILEQTLADLAPDVVFIWSMRRFSRSLILLVEKLHPAVLYYVTDNWLLDQYRPTTANLRKYLTSYRNLLQKPKVSNVICSSEHMKKEMVESGIPLSNAKIIHNGVNLTPYLSIVRPEPQDTMKILYMGRLVEQKGVHTLVTAFVSLCAQPRGMKPALSIVGEGDAQYVESLKRVVSESGNEAAVSFIGNVPREELANYFACHDIFVFPSIWQEPFSLTLIMALASGIPVVGTLTGGSKEILRDRHNSLAFQAGDSVDLADKLELLLNDQKLRASLARQGRSDALSCNLPVMIDEVETFLKGVIEGNPVFISQKVG